MNRLTSTIRKVKFEEAITMRKLSWNPLCSLLICLLLMLVDNSVGFSTVNHGAFSRRTSPIMMTGSVIEDASGSFAVPSSVLDEDASPEERTVMNVFRRCSPSVAYVTSTSSNRRSLGSGSGFVVHPAGYLVTNFHVIERAYQMQQVEETIQNITEKSLLLSRMKRNNKSSVEVKVRLSNGPSSGTDKEKFNLCRIVDVRPELDMAVLQIVSNKGDNNKDELNTLSWPVIEYGSSSKLLVGQRVMAIGNPFGLDQTLTCGIISATNREVKTTQSRPPIPGCIQTDAAINPGNSGGPLLDNKGRLVGVNTAIITTSGSNAGIGFAIPVDRVKEEADAIIDKDLCRKNKRGYLGLGLVTDTSSLDGMLRNKFLASTLKSRDGGIFVANVEKKSPAQEADISPIQLTTQSSTGSVGDRVVAVNGKIIETSNELQKELQKRVEGEQINLTLEDIQGQRRIAYLKLGLKP